MTDRQGTLAEAVERIRSHHDRSSGHVSTNTIGYCGESDGISATYCETGVLLAALHVTDTPAPDLTLCFEPGCTLPGHVSRVHEADTAAPDLCPECAHPLTEHQTPGGECVHAFCTHDESFEIVLSALREAQD